jgi:hypothetical protein
LSKNLPLRIPDWSPHSTTNTPPGRKALEIALTTSNVSGICARTLFAKIKSKLFSHACFLTKDVVKKSVITGIFLLVCSSI